MKRLSEYVNFVYSHHETQDKCILSIVTKTSQPPGKLGVLDIEPEVWNLFAPF